MKECEYILFYGTEKTDVTCDMKMFYFGVAQYTRLALIVCTAWMFTFRQAVHK